MDGVDKQEVKKAAKGNMNLLAEGGGEPGGDLRPDYPGDYRRRPDSRLSEYYRRHQASGGRHEGHYGDVSLLVRRLQFLWLAGEAIFTFLPVGVTWSVCKKMNVDQMLGIVLGITLVSPQLMFRL